MSVIALGADHAGFALKQHVKQWLVARGYTVLDAGTQSTVSADYPDFAETVAQHVVSGAAERGVLVCGTGIGMAIAANKVSGIRAGVCGDVETARLSRQHNDLNVLALAGRSTSPDDAIAIVAAWLDTPFEGGRHERRLAKVADLERPGGIGGRASRGPHVQGVAGAPAR